MLRIPRQAFARRMLAVVFLGAAALGGCTLDTDVSEPGGLLKVTSDPQAVAVNAVLANDLTVLVVNQFGERLKNVSVAWGIESGGGSISATSVLSDDSGLASVTYTAGSTAGQAVVSAAVRRVPAVRFAIVITP